MHKEDRALLGMKWEGALYVDATLPFRLRSAPKIFTAIADALEWRLKHEGAEGIFHYLDDFLILAPPNSQLCEVNLAKLTTLIAGPNSPGEVRRSGDHHCILRNRDGHKRYDPQTARGQTEGTIITNSALAGQKYLPKKGSSIASRETTTRLDSSTPRSNLPTKDV